MPERGGEKEKKRLKNYTICNRTYTFNLRYIYLKLTFPPFLSLRGCQNNSPASSHAVQNINPVCGDRVPKKRSKADCRSVFYVKKASLGHFSGHLSSRILLLYKIGDSRHLPRDSLWYQKANRVPTTLWSSPFYLQAFQTLFLRLTFFGGPRTLGLLPRHIIPFDFFRFILCRGQLRLSLTSWGWRHRLAFRLGMNVSV